MAKRDAERERKRSMHTTSRPSQFTTGTRHSTMPSDVVLIEHTVSVPPHASTGRLHVREYHRGYGDDAGSMDGLPSYDRISVTDVDIIKGGERDNYHHPHHHRHQQQREPRERYRENTEGEGDSEGETAERERGNKLPSCPVMMLQPNRRTNDGDIELGGVVRMSRGVLTRHNMKGTTVSHLIHNWRSPIGELLFTVEVGYGVDRDPSFRYGDVLWFIAAAYLVGRMPALCIFTFILLYTFCTKILGIMMQHSSTYLLRRVMWATRWIVHFLPRLLVQL